MKKLFSLIALGLLTHVSAQTCGGLPLLSEHFENGIPGTWTIFNSDTCSLYYTMPLKGYTGAWQPYVHLSKNCAANCSRFEWGGVSNDYLISPAITIPAGTACLSWRSSAAYDFYYENYDVMISTTTPTISGLQAHPVLLNVNPELTSWNEHSVDLSGYAGQTVYIGFRYYSSAYALFLDDFLVSTPVAIDASVDKVNVNEVILPSTQTISGAFLNAGTSPIISADINWNVNNGPVNSMALSSLNVAPGSYYSFSHTTQWSPSVTGAYQLKVWTSNVNSVGDGYPGNDTLTSLIYVSTFPRKVLVEEFTQASCGPCAMANPAFDAMLYPGLQDGSLSSIKYHTSWPGVDPMYDFNTGYSISRVEYYGIAGVPSALIDGVLIPNTCATFIGDPACLLQSELDSAAAVPAIYSINTTHNRSGNTMNVSVTVSAITDIPAASFRLFTGVIEDTIVYSTPPGNNGEMDFYEVFRTMLPDSNGQALPSMTSGQSLTFNYSYAIDSVFNINELATVAFIQNDANKRVYQSTYDIFGPLAVNEISDDVRYVLYPVPAGDRVSLILNGKDREHMVCRIFDIHGKEMNVSSSVTGTGVWQFDISTLANGYYFIRIESETGTHMMRFVKVQ